MSEYQYYEFRAIDTPLTESQKAEVSKLSSRAYVTSHSATFVYNYSDFPGNTEKLMATYFDSILYMANWGTRQLIFRFPVKLVDKKYIKTRGITSPMLPHEKVNLFLGKP